MERHERQPNGTTEPDNRTLWHSRSRFSCTLGSPHGDFQEGNSRFFLKPNLILEDGLTVRYGEKNRDEQEPHIYCSVNIRNDPPSGHCKWFAIKGRANARASEIWLTVRKSGEAETLDPFSLIWTLDNNPKQFDIPNNGRAYRVIFLISDPQLNRILVPTGPVYGPPGNYHCQTLPAGTYDLILEVGPPNHSVKKEWVNMTLPDDVIKYL